MDKKRILLIDDEENFCLLVKKNLELLGSFEVYTATNGKEGIRVAQTIKPDLILLDISMPKMDGFEILKILKENDATMAIPAIMLTAKKDDATKDKASQLFDEDFITKPIEAYELKTKIENVLKRRSNLTNPTRLE